MKLNLFIWRQKNAKDKGHFENHKVDFVSEDMSFLEMFDVLNEQLLQEGERACRIRP